MTVQAAEKFPQDYTLEVTNPGGHSSRPMPDNAIYHLADASMRIEVTNSDGVRTTTPENSLDHFTSAAVFARVPVIELWAAKRVLDQGVHGVIFPFTGTAEKAARAAAACRGRNRS